MHLDVTRLRDFYHTPLGQVTARLIGRRLNALWPDVKAMNVLGLGYAVPYLGPFARGGADRVISLMPAAQGVHRWQPIPNDRPGRHGNLAGIAEDAALPLGDDSMDRILMVHVFETSDRPRALLREVWRVLAPGGRLVVIAPNRIGLWSLLDRTPFGNGRPYTRAQFAATLADHMFTPLTHTTALYAPPMTSRAGVRILMALDRPGARIWSGLGGVHIIEAEKCVYAGPIRQSVRVVRAAPLRTLS